MLIDTHAHLLDDRLTAYRESIIKSLSNAPFNQPSYVINASASIDDSRASLLLAQSNERVFATVGVHPEHAGMVTADTLCELLSLASKQKVVAIGEIGLDYHYDYDDTAIEMQKRAFIEQIEVAHEAGLPVVVHTRDAFSDTVKILTDNKGKLKNGFIIHCFNGNAEQAKVFNRLGAYYSIGGAATFKRNFPRFTEVMRTIPNDRLMIETDCPYMTPEPNRGKDNIPAYCAYTLTKLNEYLEDIGERYLARQTSLNAKRAYGLNIEITD